MTGKVAPSAFIDETLLALGALQSAVTGRRGGQDGKENVERGLRTIQAGAAAHGFAELAETAGAWLELVREADPPGLPTGGADVDQLVEFIARAEELLALARDGNVPEGKFFRPPRNAGKAEPGSSRKSRKGEEPSGAAALDADIEAMLSAVPCAAPEDEAGAPRMLSMKTTSQTPSQEKPSPPAGSGERIPAEPHPELGAIEKLLSSGAAGYAFEAALAFETVRNLSLHYKYDPRFSALITNLSEFFKSFGRWAIEARSIPIGEFLKDVIAWCEKHAESGGRKLSCEVEGKSFTVLPGVGRLVRAILKEVLRRLLPAGDRGGSDVTILFSIEPSPGYFTLRLAGLPSAVQRTSTKLHLYSIQDRVEKVGMVVSQGESGNEILIDVPENLQSLEVQILRWGESVVGVPAHRVITIQEGLGAGLHGNGWFELHGEKITMIDLTEGGSSGRTPPVVVLRSEAGKLAVKVDAVLEREEMPLQIASHADWQSEVLGICISPTDFRSIPLLRWSLDG